MQSGLVHAALRLSSFLQISKPGRERTVAVDREIDGSQPSSISRRGTDKGEIGEARGATCRRQSSAARVENDCGGSRKRAGGVVLAGDAPGVGGDPLLLRGRAPTPATF